MRRGREGGQRLIEDFYDEFGNVGGLALRLLGFLDQLWNDVLVWGQERRWLQNKFLCCVPLSWMMLGWRVSVLRGIDW